MINSRDINDLDPRVAAKCLALIDACRDAGIELIVTSTYRDNECQESLYAQGRTKPGQIVTKARAGPNTSSVLKYTNRPGGLCLAHSRRFAVPTTLS